MIAVMDRSLTTLRRRPCVFTPDRCHLPQRPHQFHQTQRRSSTAHAGKSPGQRRVTVSGGEGERGKGVVGVSLNSSFARREIMVVGKRWRATCRAGTHTEVINQSQTARRARSSRSRGYDDGNQRMDRAWSRRAS